MSVTAAQVTVSTTAVALNTETGAVSGTRLTVKNTDGTNGADLGPSGVVAGAGYALAAGESVTFVLAHGEQLYAIRSAGADVVLAVLRTGA